MQKNISWIIYAILLTIVIVSATQTHNAAKTRHCKELNSVSCYTGKNDGNFCNRKDQSATETRWYYDKGVCRSFVYKGCNGNRNRFCTKENCEQRCAGE